MCGCPDRHKVFLKRGTVKQPHFAHYDISTGGNCRGGGESQEHKDAKQRLRDMRGMYSFTTEKCPECGREAIEQCADGTVDIEVRSNDKRWWYDCVYKSTSGYHIALEVFHTHATTREKIESTRQNGMQIAEFHADEINSMSSITRLHNLQIVRRFCSTRCKERREMRVEAERMALVYAEQERIDDEERTLMEEERKRMADRERQSRLAELEREEQERKKAKQAELDRENSRQFAQKAESDREERERLDVMMQREERDRNRKAGLHIDTWMPLSVKEAEEALQPFDMSPYWGPAQSLNRAARVQRTRKFGHAMEGWDWVDVILAKFPDLALGRPLRIQHSGIPQ